MADPDDSSSGTGVCGKTGAQPSWNTTTRISYFPDGSVSLKQTPSQFANGIGTAFTYDPDGNVTTETHHRGCVAVASCVPGITNKFYDGANRLVEVTQPYDGWDVQAYPWATRYIYDLSHAGTTAYRNMRLAGHGNLVSTQEFLSGTVFQPTGFSYSLSSGSWVDVRAAAFDALDRAVAQYEAAIGDSPKLQATFDSTSKGLLSTSTRPTGETRTNTYDVLGRLTDAVYSGDGGVTPGMHLGYDAGGRVISRSTDTLGAETLQYDNAGNLTDVFEPASLGAGHIGYDYYPDDLRKDVTYVAGTYSVSPVAQYTYRNDGVRQALQLNNGGRFAWTYTAGARLQSQSDPLTGTTISPTATYAFGHGAPHPLYPSTVTYVARSVTYDSYGRTASLTLPEVGFSYSYSLAQYDLEDAQLEESRNRFVNGTQTPQGVCVTTNVRGERLVNGGQTPCSSFTGSQNIAHVDLNGTMLNGVMGAGAGFWTVDARAGLKLNNRITDQIGNTVGSLYQYDSSGRMTQDSEASDKLCPPGYAYSDPRILNARCYRYGTRTKTYDAENRLHSDTYPYVNPNGPTQTSYGTSYGDYWMEEDFGFYQPASIASVDYSASGRPMRIAQQHPDQGTTQSVVWLWDGGDRFLECRLSGGQCSSVMFSVEGLADYDQSGNHVTVYDRNLYGLVAISHTATAFSAWTDAYSGPALMPRARQGTCSDGGDDPTSCGRLRTGKLTADGWTIDNDTWQGVRTLDPSVGQWNTPDAFAGTLHDPMTQKPFMFNRNNPYQYSDPSGYLIEWEGDLATQQWELEQYNQAIAYFQEHHLLVQAQMLITLRDDPTFTIRGTVTGTGTGGTYFDPDRAHLFWDARQGLSVTSPFSGQPSRESGKEAQTPALGLLHEVDHALRWHNDFEGYRRDVLTTIHGFGGGLGYETREEERVIVNMESLTAIALGEPVRFNHGGQVCIVASVTATKCL
jgi:hypothetical protein